MEPYYFTLAQQYASFLSTLGGISITVLTLVLALPRPPVDRKAYSVLIISLILATFACLTGAHLMSETAAFASPVPTKEGPTGLGPYLNATVNICIAPMLTGFSMFLLPKVYFGSKTDTEDVVGIQWIANKIFYLVAAIAWIWTLYYFLYRLPISTNLIVWVSAITVLSLAIYGLCLILCKRGKFQSRGRQTFWARFLFIVLIVCVACPVLVFPHTTNKAAPALWQMLIFYSAIMLSGVSLLCLKSILFDAEDKSATLPPA